jgi:hypothetical protein
MGVKLVDLKRDQRTILIPISLGENADGEQVTEDLRVTYRPSAYTANAELDFNSKLKGDWKSEMGLAFVHTLVIEWDLEGEDGQPVAITMAALADLPSSFVGEVIAGIGKDMGKAAERSNAS